MAGGPPALLFDLDGTLVDSATDIAAALSVIRTERGGGTVSPGEVRPLVSLGASALVSHIFGPYARADAADLAAFRDILGQLPPDPAAVYPGVRAALTALAADGHRMAIVTNKPERLARQLLETLDLARWFGAIVGGDTAAFAKPDPAPLQHALDALGATANAAIVIGDSDIDATAAARCAIPLVLYEGGYGAADCDPAQVHARFTHFDDLTATLAGLWQEEPARGS